jgi:hypothetical protein
MADEFIQVCSGVQKKLVEKIDESTGKNYYAEEVVVTGGSSVNVSVDNTDVIAAQDATTEKVELLRQQLVTLLGDQESLKTLSTQTNTLLTTLGTYNDQVESLLGTVGSNTTNLQSLLTQLGLNTDQVETLLQVVANKLDTVHADLATENTSLATINSSVGSVVTAVNAVNETLDAGNVSLSSVDSKTPLLGQALEAQSSPVVLPASQIAALTPKSNTGYALDGADATDAVQMAGGSGIRGWLSGIYTKLSSSIAVTGTFWQATQPVSAASLPLPTGAAADATLTNGTQKAQITSLPTASRSPSFSRSTTSGVVLAGAKSVSFCAVSGLCTVMGTTLLQEETVSFEAPGADTLAAIAYTVATGEIVIVEVR